MKRLFLSIVTAALCLPVWGNLCGDLTGDTQIDVSDVNMIIDMVLGKAEPNQATGDLNNDGAIDVTDVSILIDFVLGKGPTTLSATVENVDFDTYSGRTASKQFTVRGTSLSGDVSFEMVSGGDVFSVSSTDISWFDSATRLLVTVSYRSTTVGNQTGMLQISSEGVEPVNIPLTGHSVLWSPAAPSNAVTYTANGVAFKMVPVAGGTFTMGGTAEQGSDAQNNEKPTHQVTLSNYSIGMTEVTQELWMAVMGTNPSYFSIDYNRPVEYVSWNDCQEFITRLNALTGKKFRLPTEAEWEYAARGGNKSKGYKYAGSNTVDDVAWYYSNSGGKGSSHPDWGTHAVGEKQPNELGLYDMSGNVQEWCNDWYAYYSAGAQTNPTGPGETTMRVYRGGHWNALTAADCRVSYRFGNGPRGSYYYHGLRLAL